MYNFVITVVLPDSHTGAMRLWTVAKATPLENIRLKKTGFHAIQVGNYVID